MWPRNRPSLLPNVLLFLPFKRPFGGGFCWRKEEEEEEEEEKLLRLCDRWFLAQGWREKAVCVVWVGRVVGFDLCATATEDYEEEMKRCCC